MSMRISQLLFNIVKRLLTRPIIKRLANKTFKVGESVPTDARVRATLLSWAVAVGVFAAVVGSYYVLTGLTDRLDKIILAQAAFVWGVLLAGNVYHIRREIWRLPKALGAFGASLLQAVLVAAIVLIADLGLLAVPYVPAEIAVNVLLLVFLYFAFFFGQFITDGGYDFWDRPRQFKAVVSRQWEVLKSLLSLEAPLGLVILSVALVRHLDLPWNLPYFLAGFDLLMLTFLVIFYRKDAVILSNALETLRLVKKSVLYALISAGSVFAVYMAVSYAIE